MRKIHKKKKWNKKYMLCRAPRHVHTRQSRAGSGATYVAMCMCHKTRHSGTERGITYFVISIFEFFGVVVVAREMRDGAVRIIIIILNNDWRDIRWGGSGFFGKNEKMNIKNCPPENGTRKALGSKTRSLIGKLSLTTTTQLSQFSRQNVH